MFTVELGRCELRPLIQCTNTEMQSALGCLRGVALQRKHRLGQCGKPFYLQSSFVSEHALGHRGFRPQLGRGQFG